MKGPVGRALLSLVFFETDEETDKETGGGLTGDLAATFGSVVRATETHRSISSIGQSETSKSSTATGRVQRRRTFFSRSGGRRRQRDRLRQSVVLDWALIQHLDPLLRTYVSHYNAQGPHRGLELAVPDRSCTVAPLNEIPAICRRDLVGGLIKESTGDLRSRDARKRFLLERMVGMNRSDLLCREEGIFQRFLIVQIQHPHNLDESRVEKTGAEITDWMRPAVAVICS
jgi:hypothetical protein